MSLLQDSAIVGKATVGLSVVNMGMLAFVVVLTGAIVGNMRVLAFVVILIGAAVGNLGVLDSEVVLISAAAGATVVASLSTQTFKSVTTSFSSAENTCSSNMYCNEKMN